MEKEKRIHTDRERASKRGKKDIIWHKKKPKRSETAPTIEPPWDYLKEMQQEWKERGVSMVHQVHQWEKDLRNRDLRPDEKYEQVKYKAKQLEKEAIKREQLKKTANFGLEEEEKLAEEANDMYFESI